LLLFKKKKKHIYKSEGGTWNNRVPLSIHRNVHIDDGISIYIGIVLNSRPSDVVVVVVYPLSFLLLPPLRYTKVDKSSQQVSYTYNTAYKAGHEHTLISLSPPTPLWILSYIFFFRWCWRVITTRLHDFRKIGNTGESYKKEKQVNEPRCTGGYHSIYFNL
jgi:hypothetical protein